MKNKLDQLRDMTIVVADTGNIDEIRTHRPQDATTNPSLLLKAAALPKYLPHLSTAVRTAKENNATPAAQLSEASDRFAVLIGRDILNIIPGRISTEVDARLSFNTLATVERARKIAALYREHNISTDRFLIKIAATWEGIQAARMLEKEGIQTNLTLLFSLPQAAAAAEAGAFLISPFVGRILDWHVARTGQTPCTPADDPGVQSVRRIWQYYRQHGHHTVVMGASFRNTEEIEQLAGCDRLTISPPLLAKLAADSGALPRMLNATQTGEKIPRLPADENSFRWLMNEDAMASEKLAEGIRNFTADQLQLNELLQQA